LNWNFFPFMPTPRGLKQKKNLPCPECGKLCAPMGLINHIRLKHKIKVVMHEIQYTAIDLGLLNDKFPFKQAITLTKVIPHGGIPIPEALNNFTKKLCDESNNNLKQLSKNLSNQVNELTKILSNPENPHRDLHKLIKNNFKGNLKEDSAECLHCGKDFYKKDMMPAPYSKEPHTYCKDCYNQIFKV
jgi:hypothetical protein